MTCEDVEPPDPSPKLRGAAVLLVGAMLAALLVVAVAIAWAHPGRLDTDGCHRVETRWRYADGREIAPGERHCHGTLGEARLGWQRLEDPRDPGRPAPHPLDKEREVP